jgi:hypothetical protein
MARLRTVFSLFALAVSALLALAACGGGGPDLLPGRTANEINRNLDQVRALVDEGDCAGAEDAVGQVSADVDGLSGVDSKLQAALRQGTERLGQLVSACETEALEAEAAENAAAEEAAEQAEQEAVEAEEEQFAEEQQREKREENREKKESREKKSEEETETTEESEAIEPPGQNEGVENGKGPPAETPSGNEPPAGGVGPGAVVE